MIISVDIRDIFVAITISHCVMFTDTIDYSTPERLPDVYQLH